MRLPARRQLVAATCGLLALVLALTWGFPERGPHFAHAKTDRTGLYDLAKARMLARVVGHIRAHYVSPERVDVRRMAVAAMERVQAEVPEVRFSVDPPGAGLGDGAVKAAPKTLLVTVGELTREFPLDKVTDLYELNWKLMDVFEFLERHLPPQVDLEALEYAAVNGILGTLDPHSVLLAPRVYRELQLSQKGRFGGLGISVGEVDGQLVIQQVMRDTPASEAGLEVDDKIVQIGGESTISMGLDVAVNLLRGEPGSEVTIWILRAGWKDSRPYKLVRREIQLPSVEEEALGDGIGWVHIRSFQETTDEDLMAALERLDRAPGGLQGLVLDLRDNPGGLLDKAIKVSDAFLEQGTIVTTVREGGKEREESHATLAETRARLPLVVLVNRGSASASEIVAGALKRNDRAVVIGQRTFGKGSVQVIYKIDEAALKLTVAQYLTPGDVSIQGVGIVPDIDLVTLRVPEQRPGAPFDGRMDLRPVPETLGGEASLSAHLSSDRTREEKPAIVLRLLEDLRTPTHRQRRGEARVADASVKLAKDVLLTSHSPERKQALVQLAGFFPKRQAEEDERVRAALAPLGADWRPGALAGTGKGLAELKLTLPPEVKAGVPFVATLEVRNTSRRALARLHAELESTVPGVGGREVAFGLVEPGKSASRELTLTVPPGAARAGDRVRARLYADGEATALDAFAQLAVDPRPRPAFAHAVQVVDPQGNGDGLVQRGEKVKVEAWIRNVGEGPAESVLATLRNESGPDVFIHLGRQELGPLAPGAARRAVFELEVKTAMKARLVELGLEVVDTATGIGPGPKNVELAIFPSELPARTPRSGFAVLPSFVTTLHAGASRETEPIAEAASGAVLEAVGAAGDWLEVRWTEDGHERTGWLPTERVRLATEGGVTRDAVRSVSHYRPPIVTMPTFPPFTSGRELPLEGVARFAGSGQKRRLVYIFRAHDKVFFQAVDANAGDRMDVTDLSFKASVPLEPGRNEITIVAREGEDSVTRTTFSVFRLD